MPNVMSGIAAKRTVDSVGRMTEKGRGCVKTQIAMPFGRSSTITLIKRIEYRAICAVEVCAFGKIFEFSHRLGRSGTVDDHAQSGQD